MLYSPTFFSVSFCFLLLLLLFISLFLFFFTRTNRHIYSLPGLLQRIKKVFHYFTQFHLYMSAPCLNAAGFSGVVSAAPASSETTADHSRILSPEPSAAEKRRMDFHVTAYPARVNEQLLSERALNATDFSKIEPLQKRKNQALRNTLSKSEAAEETGVEFKRSGIDTLSASHLATYFMLIGQEVGKSSSVGKHAIKPRGYFTKFISPPFDERSCYRQDYCQDEPEGFHERPKLTLENYRKDWTDEEKANVDISKNIPYLTLPESRCRRSTVYRRLMIPNAEKDDFRTISNHTYLPNLGTSFAYSAYQDNDPRRKVFFDPKIATLKRPALFFKDASEDAVDDRTREQAVRDELSRIRAMRRERLSTKAPPVDNLGADSKHAIVADPKGHGYYVVPKDKPDYIFLPRDGLRHHKF